MIGRRLRQWIVPAFLVVAVNCGALPAVGGAAKTPRPNVVVILADDLGFSDLGCYGSEIQTPAIDQLAAGGMRFSQFYNTARCWPSRAALITGLYPHQAQMAMSFGDQAPPAYSGNVPLRCRMIPELLADAGYKSYHVGKWHLNRGGQFNHTWPTGRGFMRSYMLLDHNNYFAPRSLFEAERKLPDPKPGYYVTEAFSKRAVEYLQEHARQSPRQPFFLYLAYTAPHFPLHALPDDVARYRGKYRAGWDEIRKGRHDRQRKLGIVNCPLSPRDPDAKAWDSLTEPEKDEWDARMATYAAMIHCLDRGVAAVVEQLRRMNALDDTLILFVSDNGSSAEYIVRGEGHDPNAAPGSRATFRCLEVGWSNAANTPLRMHKMWVHEGGISTPLVAHWPAGIKARGGLTHQVGHVIDILPTVLELAGVEFPKSYKGAKSLVQESTIPPAGKSLVPVLKGGERKPHEFLFWEHQGNKAIRQGDWKLVAEFNGPWELYNLRDDRCEINDLSRNHPDKAALLARLWSDYARQIGVVDWNQFPAARAKPSAEYRRK